ncbi:MAG TPA: PKD domain-containing protein [Acidimicrobiia bacterium]|nr:PKD domain-containing protein [Acidimicrobiia bacterium]
MGTLAAPAAAAGRAPGPAAAAIGASGRARSTSGAALVGNARRVGVAPAAPAHSVALGTLASSTAMHLIVALQPSDPHGLEQYATAVATPGSGAYRRYLSPHQFAQHFGATPAALAATSAALRAEGLRVGTASANRLSLPVTGSAARVGAAFGTGFRRYRLADGRTAFANTAAPLLRPAISALVQTVIGLDTVHQPQRIGAGDAAAPPARAAATTAKSAASQVVTGGPQPCAAASFAGSALGAFTADRLASMYRFSPLYGTGAFGHGVHVALMELEGSDHGDVAAYQACYGTNATVNYVPVDGGNATPRTPETNLDIETVIGLAPQATVDVYQAPPAGNAFYDVLNAIVTADTAPVVSISWGSCELVTARSDLEPFTTLFAQAAVQGQTVFAASGDDGNVCAETLGGDLSVNFPADDPYVTGVGGTRVVAEGSPPSEVVWNGCTGIGCTAGGSGGGISTAWPMPSYQADAPAGLHVINANSSGAPCAAGSGFCREVPDVAADAAPSTAYVVYEGGWTAVGGTSASAPLWAAMTALIDSTPACAGTSVGFANPALYRAAARSYATYFNDVTVGNNDESNGNHPGLFPAGPGYDMATGLGTPNAAALAGVLCQGPTAYVTNSAANTVTPIVGNVAGAPITVGTAPFGIAITPDGTTAYVGNTGSNTVTPISTITNTPGTPIPVGSLPEGLAITPDGKTLYVANGFSDTVTPISTATNTAGTPIPVGVQPNGLAITPNGKFLYVANSQSNTVTRITVATNTPSKTIVVGTTPRQLAVTPDGKTVYVANSDSNTVTPIATASNRAGAAIAVGAEPFGVAVTPDGSTVYVSNSGSNTVTPIATATKSAGAAIAVGASPFDLTVTPDGSAVEVTRYGDDSIVSIATATNTAGAAVPVGHQPQGIAIAPDQGPVARFTHGVGLAMSFSALTSGAPGTPIATYTWDFGDGTAPVSTGAADVSHTFARQGSYRVRLTATDTTGTATTRVFTGRTVSRNGAKSATATTLVVAQPVDAYILDTNNDWLAPLDGSAPTAVGTYAFSFAITPDGRTAYVASYAENTVTPVTISTHTAGTPIAVAGGPDAVAISPDGSTVYVAGEDGNIVTPVDTATGTPRAAIPVGAQPGGIVVTPDGKTVYVANSADNTVTPITAATGVTGPAIPVGAKPSAVTVTPNGKTVYVSNYLGNSVTPITVATDTAGPAIPVGARPIGVAVNPNGRTVYIANSADNTVTPITVATNAAGPAIRVGLSPYSIAFSPDGALAYVAGLGTLHGDGSDGVTPIQTATNAVGARIPTTVGTYEPRPIDIATLPDQAPSAAFSAVRGRAGQPTQFDASASIANGAPIVSYQWTFGDGSSAAATTPTVAHTYAVAGNYRVRLTLTDAYGTSTRVVFTGRTVSRNGSKHAAVTVTVRIKS